MNEQGENKTRHQEEHVTKGVLFSIIRLSHDFIIAHVVYNAERGCQKDEFHNRVVPVVVVVVVVVVVMERKRELESKI